MTLIDPTSYFTSLFSTGTIIVTIFLIFEFMLTLSIEAQPEGASNAHIYAEHEKKPVVRRKPAEILRVVKDPYNGEEILIGGKKTTTYGEACREDWDFKGIDKKASWILRDDKGNDITNMHLADYDGIVVIELLELEGHKTSDREKEDSKHMGVEYYD